MSRHRHYQKRRGLARLIHKYLGFTAKPDGAPSTKLPPRLTAEVLEPRQLLTTLTLPAGETDISFWYRDPENVGPGATDPTSYNEVRLGTLSGVAPVEDVIVTFFDYEGKDILGLINEADNGIGDPQPSFFGGIDAGESLTQQVVRRIPLPGSSILESNAAYANTGQGSFHALAANAVGDTYGFVSDGFQAGLLEINEVTGFLAGDATPIPLVDRNPAEYSDFIYYRYVEAAEFDPLTGDLYAIVADPYYTLANSGLQFSINPDNPLTPEDESLAPIVVKIDLSPDNFGEVDPVGTDSIGNPNYTNSTIFGFGTLDATTMVYSESGDNDGRIDEAPIFIVNYAGRPASDLTIDGVGDVAVLPSLGTFQVITDAANLELQIVSETRRIAYIEPDESLRIEGLFYGEDCEGDNHLWGLNSPRDDDGNVEEGGLVLLDLSGNSAFITPVEKGFYPPHPNSGVETAIMSATHNALSGFGYGTDQFGYVHQIRQDVLKVIYDDVGQLVIEFCFDPVDIFSFYVEQSSPDVLITFTAFELDRTTGLIIYNPQGNGGSSYIFIDGSPKTPDEAGGVMIGADQQPLDQANLVPFASSYENPSYKDPFGRRPGIFVGTPTNHQDIGRIQIGGVIFGDVEIYGAADAFIAGGIATNNFSVFGDINTIASYTSVGGFEYYEAADAKMTVLGDLTRFYANWDWKVELSVVGSSAAYDFPGILSLHGSDTTTQDFLNPSVLGVEHLAVRELENFGHSSGGSIYYGENVTGWFRLGGLDNLFDNSTPAAAEFVGSGSGNVSVFGVTNVSFTPGKVSQHDQIDYYAFAMEAGQTTTLTLNAIAFQFAYQEGGQSVGSWIPSDSVVTSNIKGNFSLLDPEYEVVATGDAFPDRSDAFYTGNLNSMTFTAERAGIYTVGITQEVSDVAFSYRLDIENLMETSLAGGTVLRDVYPTDEWETIWSQNFLVITGNVGGISVGGGFGLDEGQIIIGGDLGAIRVGAANQPLNQASSFRAMGATSQWGFGTEMGIGGNVGLLSSYSTGWTNYLYALIGGDLSAVRVGTDLFADGSNTTTDGGTHLTGTIAVDGSIGEIYATGHLGSISGDQKLNIWANADGDTEVPGVIDAIISGGQFSGDVFVGGTAGNVRFIDIGGAIYTSRDATYTIAPGESLDITDDGGAIVRISNIDETNDGFYIIGGTTDDDATDDDATDDDATDGDATDDDATGDDATGDDATGDDATDDDTNTDDSGSGSSGDTTSDDEDAEDEEGTIYLKMLPVNHIAFDDFNSYLGGYIPLDLLGYAIASIESTTNLQLSVPKNPFSDTPVEIGLIQASGNIRISGNNPVSIMRAVMPSENGDAQFVNTTLGDVLALQISGSGEANVSLIDIAGNFGVVTATTGHKIRGKVIGGVRGESPNVNPGGMQYAGLQANASIKKIKIDGTAGRMDVNGDVKEIVLNADNDNLTNTLQGANGAIVIKGSLDTIALGEGLPNPGQGFYANTGIFVFGDIGEVNIKGSGHTINGPIYSTGDISSVNVTQGAQIRGFNTLTTVTIASTVSMDLYKGGGSGLASAGNIDKIVVSGTDATVRGAFFFAVNIGSISIAKGAEGLFNAIVITTSNGSSSEGNLRSLVVGGAGIHDTFVYAEGDIKAMTVKSGGVIQDSNIIINHGYKTKIIADEINGTTIDSANIINSVHGRHGITELNVSAGRINKIYSGGDLIGARLNSVGDVKSVTVKGDMIGSIDFVGQFSYLKKLNVKGDVGTPVGGVLSVQGKIGSLKVGGDFFSQLYLNWSQPSGLPGEGGTGNQITFSDPDNPAKVLDKMNVSGQIMGLGDIGGSIGTIKSGGIFGILGATFHVHGDLKKLTVGSTKNRANLESNMIIDGDLGSVLVYGNVNGNISALDNFKSLTLKGVKAKNNILEQRSNLAGNIVVGGNFNALTILYGDMESFPVVDGKGPKIKVPHGNVILPGV